MGACAPSRDWVSSHFANPTEFLLHIIEAQVHLYERGSDPKSVLHFQEPPLEWQRGGKESCCRTQCSSPLYDGCDSFSSSFSAHWHLYTVSLGVQPGSPRWLESMGGDWLGCGGVDLCLYEAMVAKPLSIAAYRQWQITFLHCDLIRN